MNNDSLSLLGIGNAITDLIVECSEETLQQFTLQKGHMQLLTRDQLHHILANVSPMKRSCGGSVANTIIGLASLGHSCGYLGKLGKDEIGDFYASELIKTGVTFFSTWAPHENSGTSIIFVTPDHERTMATYLGAAASLSEDSITEEIICSTQQLYLEGYVWDGNHGTASLEKAAFYAKRANITTAFSLSDGFCVTRHREAWLPFLRKYITLLFANEEELCTLVGTSHVEEALRSTLEWCPLVVVTRGEQGSIIGKAEQLYYCPAAPAEVKDLTGAGDLYACGFYHGLLQGRALAECGALGAIAAAEVISHHGNYPLTPLVTLFSTLPSSKGSL